MAVNNPDLATLEANTAALLVAAWPYLNSLCRKNVLEHGQVRFPGFFNLLNALDKNWTGDVTMLPLDAIQKDLAKVNLPNELIDLFLQNYLDASSRFQIILNSTKRPTAATNIQRTAIDALKDYLHRLFLARKESILESVNRMPGNAWELPIHLAEALEPYQIENQDEPSSFQEDEEYYASGEEDQFSYVISTGFNALDAATGGGFKPNRMTLLEASRGTGKTSLSLQFILEAIKQEKHCLVLSLEMKQLDMRNRIRVQAYGMPMSSVENVMRNRQLTEEMRELSRRFDELVSVQWFDATSSDAIKKIPVILEDYRRNYGVYPELVVLDYIQNMVTDEDSVAQLVGISKIIFEYGKRYHTHFIVTSQVKDGRAYGAQAMEDAPDLVLLLNKHDTNENLHVLEMRKNRFGPEITVELEWYGYINTHREVGQGVPPVLQAPTPAVAAQSVEDATPPAESQPATDPYKDIPF